MRVLSVWGDGLFFRLHVVRTEGTGKIRRLACVLFDDCVKGQGAGFCRLQATGQDGSELGERTIQVMSLRKWQTEWTRRGYIC